MVADCVAGHIARSGPVSEPNHGVFSFRSLSRPFTATVQTHLPV
jgi:hypothetical protein